MSERKTFCTSFCNFAHYQDTGRPIGHECYVIAPKALAEEMRGEFRGPAWAAWSKRKGASVVGRAMPEGAQ
jgi:hypothetical protein